MNRSLATTLIGLALLGAACSSDEPPGESRRPQVVEQPESEPLGSPAPDSTPPNRAPAEPDEAEVLGDQLLSRVHISASGRDSNAGTDSNQAVRTLGAALDRLAPGGTVLFEPGVYPPLRIEGISGTAAAPIRLEANGNVEFRDEDYRSGAGILVSDTTHVEIVGMQVRHALWGFYIRRSHHVSVIRADVRDIGQEGIRVKDASSNITLNRNLVADTGRRTDQGRPNGEGIYIGTGSPGGVDHVSKITVINNTILRTTDEAIDIKRPATDVVVVGNEIRDIATHTSGAIVVHLNGDSPNDPNIRLERNVITNVTRTSQYRDGNCIVSQVTITIRNNVLHDCQHRGIFLRGNAGTAVVEHNTLLASGDLGAIVSEGRGMTVVSRNNLGAAGDANRQAGSDSFVDAAGGDYRLTDQAAPALTTAPSIGVSDDLFGRARPPDGATFGAVEMLATGGAAPSPPPTVVGQPASGTPTPPPSDVAPVPVSGSSPSSNPSPTPPPTTAAPSRAERPSGDRTPSGIPSPSAVESGPSALTGRSITTQRDSCLDALVCEWAPLL